MPTVFIVSEQRKSSHPSQPVRPNPNKAARLSTHPKDGNGKIQGELFGRVRPPKSWDCVRPCQGRLMLLNAISGSRWSPGSKLGGPFSTEVQHVGYVAVRRMLTRRADTMRNSPVLSRRRSRGNCPEGTPVLAPGDRREPGEGIAQDFRPRRWSPMQHRTFRKNNPAPIFRWGGQFILSLCVPYPHTPGAQRQELVGRFATRFQASSSLAANLAASACSPCASSDCCSPSSDQPFPGWLSWSSR